MRKRNIALGCVALLLAFSVGTISAGSTSKGYLSNSNSNTCGTISESGMITFNTTGNSNSGICSGMTTEIADNVSNGTTNSTVNSTVDSTANSLATDTTSSEITLTEDGSIDVEKLVYSCNLIINTKEYDETVEDMEDTVKAAGGFIEDKLYSEGTYYAQDGTRYSSYSLRVPVEEYDTVIKKLEDLGTVSYFDENVRNISKQFKDLNKRLSVYQDKYAVYSKMLKDAKTVDEVLKVQDALFETQNEIEGIQNRLNTIESDTTYSYINAKVQEEKEVEEVVIPTFKQRVKSAFSDSWKDFVGALGVLAVNCVYYFPYILIGMIAVVIAIICTLKRKKAAEKKGVDAMAETNQKVDVAEIERIISYCVEAAINNYVASRSYENEEDGAGDDSYDGCDEYEDYDDSYASYSGYDEETEGTVDEYVSDAEDVEDRIDEIEEVDAGEMVDTGATETVTLEDTTNVDTTVGTKVEPNTETTDVVESVDTVENVEIVETKNTEKTTETALTSEVITAEEQPTSSEKNASEAEANGDTEKNGENDVSVESEKTEGSEEEKKEKDA